MRDYCRMSILKNHISLIDADIHTLFESDFYRILDFKCKCIGCETSRPEYTDSFTMAFVRKGNFSYNVFRNSFDSYTGCMLITKPGYEKTVTHRHTVPDECTILDFKPGFYEEILEEYGYLKFLLDNDHHSAFVKTSAETELLHRFIISQMQTSQCGKLEIDSMVMDLIATAFGKITSYTPNYRITESLKKNHLGTIERGKDFIVQNFQNDVSLKEIADHCFVSSFHFARIFKNITGYSPHQFLLHVRLKNAALLLQNTKSKILDIAFSSGFNSLEHFSAAFKLRYGYAPRSLKRSSGTDL